MQAAVHPKPIRLILEVQASELQGLVGQLLDRLMAHPTVAPPRPPPDPDDEEDDDEPAPAYNLPPPVAHSPPLPVLPAHVAATRVLGKPCAHGHTYEDTGLCLRKRSNRGCVACERQRDLAAKQAKAAPPPARPTLVTAASAVRERPELPSHWEGRAFLSPIVCTVDPTHRYRGLEQWTLRYTDSELCVPCCTEANPALALAEVGD
jgi:hypothetical protein